MKSNHKAWQNLVAAAWRAPARSGDGSGEAPYGFATRVAALGLRGDRAGADASATVFARLCVRVCGVACMLAAGAVAMNLPALARLGSGTAEARVVVTAGNPAPSKAPALAAPGGGGAVGGDGLDDGVDDPVAEVVNLAS